MADYVKEKLSQRAVDDFMLRYEDKGEHRKPITYTTRAGKEIKVCPAQALMGTGTYIHFCKQLSVIHKGLEKFPINQMAVIRKKDGRDVLWTKDTQLLKTFVEVGERMGLFWLERGPEGVMVCLNILVDWSPVIHDEVE